MRKILKYLKCSIPAIIAILVLLFVQAMCDLALPEYTSNIVNVGIQQRGIESTAPKVLRESTYQMMTMGLSESDKQLVDSHYRLLNKEDLSDSDYEKYSKSYPLLASENLYLLHMDGAKQEVKEQIETIMSTSMMQAASMMSGDSGQTMTGDIDEMPESIVNQTAIAVIQQEYEAIGVDMDQMQNEYVLLAGGKMLLFSLVVVIASIIIGYLASKVAAKLGKDLRGNVFKKVMSYSSVEYDKFSTASLITRSTNDIQQVQMIVVLLLRMMLYAPIMAVGGVIKALNTNFSMAWVIGIAVLAIVSIVVVLFSISMPRFKQMQKLVDRMNLVMREILTGLSVIRAFSTEKYEKERFDKANVDLTKTNLFVNRVMTFMMPVMMLVMNAISVLIVWQGAKGIDLGNMQVGDLMAFIQYTMQIIMSFLMLSMMSIMLPRASVSAARISEILDSEVSIVDPEKEEAFIPAKKGFVEFKNVSFRYPGADEDVLSELNFVAKPGETTAIIGSTGSGKSTLVNLIPRFYDVTAGQILLDGVDIRNVTQHNLRDKLGFVPQKGILFSGTIKSNLQYGKEDLSTEEMMKAANIAQAEDFISQKEDGYESDISQGGSNVSGGQKQRLAIARAIAKNPEIYVFDDSFSALDFKTDFALRKALNEELKDSTLFIVAQRISTIMHAEQILVLDDGKIVGKGTHKELLKTCETYEQIASSQMSQKELYGDSPEETTQTTGKEELIHG